MDSQRSSGRSATLRDTCGPGARSGQMPGSLDGAPTAGQMYARNVSPTSKNTVKAVYSAELWRRKGLEPERAVNADTVTDMIDLGALLTWVIDRAENGEEATIITQGDRDVAAVVPMAVLRRHLYRLE